MDDTTQDVAKRAVVTVGEGRGFIIEATLHHIQGRLIVTAAHCLPHLPPPLATASAEERTYAELLGPLPDYRIERNRTRVWRRHVPRTKQLAAIV